MRKTKIVCTLGPASNSEEIIEKLILSGMDAARFNFSHGTHETHLALLTRFKHVRDSLGRPVATILDTKGPEIRIRTFRCGQIALAEGDALLRQPTACIRCGRCVAACPMCLMPTKLEQAVERQDVEALQSLDIMTCMECGCCSFSCPAGRRLVQAIRLGKNYVRKAGGKK